MMVTREQYLYGLMYQRAAITETGDTENLVDMIGYNDLIQGLSSVNEALMKMLIEKHPDETYDSLLTKLTDDAFSG